MKEFVCVRIVQANAMDLSLFQFDYDLTFAAFFMNPDMTIYGRFGTRSSRKDALKDISLEGFRKALAGALEIHKGYPANKATLAGKKGARPRYKVPEDYPKLKKYKSKIDYGGNVVKSCMHCHQILDAEREMFRSAHKPIPDDVLFPYPMPEVLGLRLDSTQRAKVESVAADSPAATAGFKSGDELLTLEGQPILSIADVQWVLHNAGESTPLRALVRRGDQQTTLRVDLGKRWRRGDITWRVSTWDLRRMGTGGLVLEEVVDADRREAELSAAELALRVKGMGNYRPHDTAKRAGFKKGDIIVAFNRRTERMTTSELFAYIMQNTSPGERVPVTVLRAGRRVELRLLMQ